MKNGAFIVCIVLWVFVTILRIVFHQPWFDEANAWEIARNMQFGNMLESMQTEGHFFVWYLLLMLFSKMHIGYPYVMLLLNWIFCFLSIVIMWLYAPFNNYLKVFITFSFPFLGCYSVIARCYSIGILPIFLLTLLYKNRLKNPIIYALLVVFTMNTSFVALIGAIIFGVYLIYDLYKASDWKNFKICMSLAIISGIWTIVQILNFSTRGIPDEKIVGINWMTILNSFHYLNPVMNAILLIILLLGFIICLFKNKRMFFLVIFVFTSMLGVFKVTYSGDFWHYYFLYVYLICSTWIVLEQNEISETFKKVLTVLLSVLSILLIFDVRNIGTIYNSHSGDIANYIIEHKKDNHIFYHFIFMQSSPYYKGDRDFSISIAKFQEKLKPSDTDFKLVKRFIKPNKRNHIYFYPCIQATSLETDFEILQFSLEKNYENNFCIYEVTLKNK